MAEQQPTYEFGTATGTDLADHRRTYAGFLRVARYAAAVIAVILIGMALFLT